MTGPEETARGVSLQARATGALLRLAALDEKQQSDAETSAIENARSRAETTLTLLDESISAARVLSEMSVELIPLEPRRRKDAGDSRRALRTAASAFLDPDTPLTNRLNGQSVQGALKQADDVARAVLKGLNAAVNSERLRLLPADICEPIPDVPSKFAVYRRVRNAKERLETPVESRRASDLPVVLRQLHEYAATWAQLRPELQAAIAELPPEVRGFVEAASTDEGVPWSQLTRPVREWLDEGDHGETYRVRRW